MTPASSAIHDALARFFSRYLAAVHEATHDLPWTEHDDDVPSVCEVPPVDAAGLVRWRPIPRHDAHDLSVLTAALQGPVRPEVAAWLTAWWTFPIEADWHGVHVIVGGCSDPLTLAQRLAGAARHVVECMRTKRVVTVPVAIFTDDRFVAVEHDTGVVVIEAPGEAPRGACADLATWVDALLPLPL
jgi:hypothetical protein